MGRRRAHRIKDENGLPGAHDLWPWQAAVEGHEQGARCKGKTTVDGRMKRRLVERTRLIAKELQQGQEEEIEVRSW